MGLIEVDGILDYFNQFLNLMAIICDELNNQTESKA